MIFSIFSRIKILFLICPLFYLSGCCGSAEPSISVDKTLSSYSVPITLTATSYSLCDSSGNHFIGWAAMIYGYNVYVKVADRAPFLLENIELGYDKHSANRQQLEQSLTHGVSLHLSPNQHHLAYRNPTTNNRLKLFHFLPKGSGFPSIESEENKINSATNNIPWRSLLNPKQIVLTELINESALYGSNMMWNAVAENTNDDDLTLLYRQHWNSGPPFASEVYWHSLQAVAQPGSGVSQKWRKLLNQKLTQYIKPQVRAVPHTLEVRSEVLKLCLSIPHHACRSVAINTLIEKYEAGDKRYSRYPIALLKKMATDKEKQELAKKYPKDF